MSRLTRSLTTLGFLIGLMLCSSAKAQVERLLDSAENRIRSQGYSLIQRFGGSLDENRWTGRNLRLQAGHAYLIHAVCDSDCRDLDLRLFSEYGSEVASDLDPDDHPLLIYRPTQTGLYSLRIIMAACAADPCSFGGALYTREAGNVARAALPINTNGYQSIVRDVSGSLDAMHFDRVNVFLQRGHAYMIVGVCDRDCSDLDLRVFQPGGSLIAQDRDRDDTPRVDFVAPVTGNYAVHADMIECRVEPCAYRIRIVEK